MATNKPQEPMCVVEIGYELSLAMPATKGLALVKLLSSGVAKAETDFTASRGRGGYVYQVTPLPAVSLTIVNAEQLISAGKPIPRAAALPAPTKEV